MKKFNHGVFIVYCLYENKKKAWKNILFYKYINKRKAIDKKFYFTSNGKLKNFHILIRYKSLIYIHKNNCNISIGTLNNFLHFNY
jgi:hypothetical protein